MDKAIEEKLKAEGWIGEDYKPLAVSHSAGARPFGSSFASYPKRTNVKPKRTPAPPGPIAVNMGGFNFNIRDKTRCHYCGEAFTDELHRTRDHIIPTSKGGSNLSDNIVYACDFCNTHKGDKSVDEFAEHIAHYRRKISAKDTRRRNYQRMIMACLFLREPKIKPVDETGFKP